MAGAVTLASAWTEPEIARVEAVLRALSAVVSCEPSTYESIAPAPLTSTRLADVLGLDERLSDMVNTYRASDIH